METKEGSPARREPERGLSDVEIHDKDKIIPLNYKHLGEKISLNNLNDTQLAKDDDVIRAEDYLVTLGREVPKPDIAIRYNGSNIATLGNLSLIIGKAKSRKTFFTTILSAAVCKQGGLYGYSGDLPSDKRKVVIFDTEQSLYYAQLALKRMQLLGANMDDIMMFALRPLETTDRIDFIKEIIYSKDDIGIVVIDGIRDLVFDVNDPREATELVGKLMRWSYDLNIHIVNVLHQNKNDGNARGHLGSELTNKCETVLSVAKSDGDDTVSVVTSEYCRSVEPQDFYFEIDINGLPVKADHAEIRTATKTKTFDIRELPGDEVFALFENIFNGGEIGYMELLRQTKYHFQNTFAKSIGDNKAKDLLTHAKNKGWIIQNGDKKPYRLGRIDEELTPQTNDMPF